MPPAAATLRVDPHVHSEGSYDAREPVELILEHASDIGLDGVVVTDHDAIDESLRAAELAPDYGLVGIPGVEVSTAAGHLLAIGVDERPEPGRSLATTIEAVRSMGGAAVVPHPFQRSRHGVRKRRLVDCDGIEVYNSMLFTGYRNFRANAFARRRGYPRLGGSDAHAIGYVGRAYTEVALPDHDAGVERAEVDAGAVVDALRAGETGLQGRRTPIHRSARQYARGALRRGAFHLTATMPLVEPWPTSLRNL